ncbi:MAG: LysE family translocator [Propionibacteriales bacterium]|nr:LysE family translocator [Propionibacteriales bacterium]
MTWAFWLTTLIVVATPGTGAVYTISAGLSRGMRAGLVAALGCTVGVIPHMVAAITGLAALLNASATAFAALKWAGVAYLLYLAVQTWRDHSDLIGTEATPQSAGQVIRTAVLINLLNPKLTIFFFAFLPQFVPVADPLPTVTMVTLSLAFMLATFMVFAVYGAFAAGVRDHVLQRPRVVQWLRRSFAATYVVLAGRLAIQEH